MENKEKKVYNRDYNAYKKRQVVEVKENRADKPLMFGLVFVLTVLIFVSTFFPMVTAYMWSDELGWTQSHGATYPGSVYSLLNLLDLAEGLEGGGSGTTPGGDGSDIMGTLIDIIVDNEQDIAGLIKQLELPVIFTFVMIALVIVQFILSMCGVIGGKNLENIVKVISMVTVLVAAACLISSACVHFSDRFMSETIRLTVKFAFGPVIMLLLSLGQAAVAFFVKR